MAITKKPAALRKPYKARAPKPLQARIADAVATHEAEVAERSVVVGPAQDTPQPRIMAADEPPAEMSQDGLVKMTKGTESLHVHPTTVSAHQSAGWVVV